MRHLRVAGLGRHPCKREPLPFIYVECTLSSDPSIRRTRKSNGLPPFWPEILTFALPASASNATLTLTFIESRLFMLEEIRGRITLPLSLLPIDAVLMEWVPLVPAREGLEPMEALIVAHLTTAPGRPFSAPRGGYAADRPSEARDVTRDDFWRLPSECRPPADEDRGTYSIFEECFDGSRPFVN